MAEEMNPEQEHRELFGPLVTNQAAAFGTALLDSGSTASDGVPNKAPRLDNGKRGRTPGNSQPSHPFGHGGYRPRGGPKGDKHQSLIKAMARLVLRQETGLQVLKQNSAWDVYLQPGQQGPLPMLFRASEAYRSEAKSKRMDCPLRAQLLHTLFQTVLTCIQNIKDSAAQTQAAQQRGWLTKEGRWVYQQWDPQAQALTVDGSRPPLENQELLTLLHAMAQAVLRKDVVHRFNATHQLAADPRGTTRFMLEIGLRADGVMDVWKGLEALQGLAALQIVGMQLRRDGLAALQFGGGHSADAGRTLGLILNNPTQHCYINSFVLAWLWIFGLLEAPEAQFFGDHVQAWRDVLYSHTPITVYRLTSWTRLFRGWHAPASQHDAADFITHVMRRMQPLALQGEWQSRLGQRGEMANVIDSGSLLSPIVLHLLGDGQEDDLQSCIHRWHQQAYRHGLKEAYPVIMIQLARYQYGDDGASKDRTGVAVPRKLLLPIFGRGLKTFPATYTVCSIIIHHGNQPDAGHYTSLLLEPGALPRSKLWGTDDGKVAKSYGRFPKCVERDAYIFILARCRFPAAGGTSS